MVQNDDFIDDDQKKGLHGLCKLFTLPGTLKAFFVTNVTFPRLFPDFDVVQGAVPEIMHLWDLGVIKCLFIFTFKGMPARAHYTKYVRQKPDRLNLMLGKSKVKKSLV